MEIRACYAGSFDPVTLGHLDLIRRAAALCDRLVVAVARNAGKEPLFTPEERAAMIRAEITDLAPRVGVEICPGLAVDFCRARGLALLVRGARTASDFETEVAMAHTNRRLAPGIETVVLVPAPAHAATSSRLIKEIAAGGGPLEDFVPPAVARALQARLRPPAS